MPKRDIEIRDQFRAAGYELIEQIAEGASATVHRARQIDLDRIVALKILSPGLFSAQETRSRLLREAKLQASLSHPNLVGILDAGLAGDRPFLATDLIEGGSLRDLLSQRHSLDLATALTIAAGIAAGLSHAHQSGIIHRDLKPENVLLTEQLEPKVADFGLALPGPGKSSIKTRAGVILGTPGYLAPELLDGTPASVASDLYAFGVVLFELLTGRRPFLASRLDDLFRQQRQDRPPLLQEVGVSCPAALQVLIEQCLAVDPAGRPDEARQLQYQLRRLNPGGNSGGQETVPMAESSDRLGGAGIRGPETRRFGTPEAGSYSNRSWSRFRSSGAGLTILTLVGVLTVAGTLHRGPPSRTGPSDQPGRSQPLKTTPLVPRITCSSSEILLTFREPLDSSVALSVRSTGDDLSRSVSIPGGTQNFRVAGLRDNTTYQIQFRNRPGGGDLVCRTLRKIPGSAFEFLESEAFSPSQQHLASRGKHVVMVWVRKLPAGEYLVMRESHDSGVTWTRLTHLNPPVQDVNSPQALLLESGLLVSWHTRDGTDSPDGRIRFRPVGASGWGPSRPAHSLGHGLPLAEAPNGQAEVVTWDGKGNRFLWSQFSPAEDPLASARPGPPLSNREGTHRLFTSPRASVLMHRQQLPGTRWNRVQWSRSLDPRAGDWSRPAGVSPALTKHIHYDGIFFRGNLHLAYAVKRGIELRLYDPVSDTLGAPNKLYPDTQEINYPGFAASRNSLFLTVLRAGLAETPTMRLEIHGSTDGHRWTLRDQFHPGLFAPKETACAVAGDRLVIAGRSSIYGVFVTSLPLSRLE